MKVKIARTAHELVLSEAARDAAHEVCGLLIGHENMIEEALPATNVAADTRRMFEIDPAILLGAHREARRRGRLVVGHYHSHPGGKPMPSLRDAASAHQDGALWIIVGDGGAIAGFRALRGGAIAGRFDPVRLEVV